MKTAPEMNTEAIAPWRTRPLAMAPMTAQRMPANRQESQPVLSAPTQLPAILIGKTTNTATKRTAKSRARRIMCATSFFWGLTFDMSGGAKRAQRALGRPLDGGVRFQY